MAKYVAINQLGAVKEHLGVSYEIGNDNCGRYIEANMFDFVQGMTDDYVKLTGSLPKQAATPALPGNNSGEERRRYGYATGVSFGSR